MVYYDDMMLQQYKNDHSRVKQKLRAVMAFVKELYSEKDTLKTVLKVKTVAIEHAGNGQNWGTTSWRYWSRPIYLFLVKFYQINAPATLKTQL